MRFRQSFNNYIKSKLANQIILVVVSILILQLLIFIVVYVSSYREQKRQVIENNIKILQQANENYFSLILDQLSTLTTEIFYNDVFWNSHTQELTAISDNEIYSILASAFQSQNIVDSVYLYSSMTDKCYIMDDISFSGIPVKTGQKSVFFTTYTKIADSRWFLQAKQNRGNLVVTRNSGIREKNTEIVSFSRCLYHPLSNQKNYYVICININKMMLAELTKQICNYDEMLMILDPKNQSIYESDDIIEGKEESFAVDHNNNKSEEWYNQKIGGVKYVIIRYTAEIKQWSMIKLIPENAISRGLIDNLKRTFLMMSAIILFGVLSIYYVIIGITKPINKLAKIMRHYNQGEVALDTNLAQRSDEIGILYTSFDKMNKRIDQLIESEYQSQIQEKQAKLEALQAQLDPHFLYNTLQIISGIAIEENITSIELIINSLSNFLRYTLNGRKSIVKVSEEVDNVNNYMNIMKYRYGDRISIEIELSEEILECYVPVFTLQLAVENAIKHGLEKKVGHGLIKIYDNSPDKKHRILYIEDNGVGMDKGQLNEIRELLNTKIKATKNGFDQKGLCNLNERIRQHFGGEYGISLESNITQGVTIIITIPV